MGLGVTDCIVLLLAGVILSLWVWVKEQDED